MSRIYGEHNIGEQYNYLTVVGLTRDAYGSIAFDCECVCGKRKAYVCNLVAKGYVKSCGCKSKELAKGINYSGHVVNDSRLRKVYKGMKNRCYNEYSHSYKNYGGRGITVCDEWLNDFKVFEEWAIATGYDKDAERNKYTLDRIDVNKGYSPENCRWITGAEQQRNKRNNVYITIDGVTKLWVDWRRDGLSSRRLELAKKGLKPVDHTYECNGERLTVKEMSDKYGLYPQTIAYRIKQGMTASEAVNMPKKPQGRGRKKVAS